VGAASAVAAKRVAMVESERSPVTKIPSGIAGRDHSTFVKVLQAAGRWKNIQPGG
jgi:hypothetical protein